MRLDDLDYDLPEDLIAQEPVSPRDAARLLRVARGAGGLEDRHVRELPDLLAPGDLLVVNDTQVLAARLLARRETGGRVEVFVLEAVDEHQWRALVRSSKGPREGEQLWIGGQPRIEVVAAEGEGMWRVRAVADGVAEDMADLLASAGRMPLPPYIHREDEDVRAAEDRERYQTVYAKHPGAVAAPTAGLHFTPALLAALEARGIERTAVTLHVGLGTFAPVRSEDLDDHPMHEEAWWVGPEAREAVRACRARGGRVVAVGTTSVRALESAAALDFEASHGRTRLLIQPGYRFHCVDALLTNFHLPRSTLLALVSALLGHEATMAAYRHAVAERYRFYSYGDAMLIT